ncbi:MAG: SH3 domain-containing protein, partial [Clostridia bacterium]
SDSYQAGLIAGIASFLQTMPRDIYRDHPVLCAPIMENRRSTTEKMTVYATPDTSSAVLATIGRNYRVFALDNLGNGFTQVQTYQKGIVGYTDCQTLTPCR